MAFDAANGLKLFTGLSWVDVHATLLADALLLVPLQKLELINSCNKGNGNEISVLVHIARKDSCGLGISIKGGKDFGAPIIISKIFKGMSADQSKQLSVGDVILSVNGEDMRSASHNEAVKALKMAGSNIRLEIKPMLQSTFLFHRLQSKLSPSPLGSISLSTSMANAPTTSRPSLKCIQIPLVLVYVVRRRHRQCTGLIGSKCEVSTYCCIEIFSPDLGHSCSFCAGSPLIANVWFNSLSRHISILNQLYLQRIMRTLPHTQVRKIGWVLELDQVIDDENASCFTNMGNLLNIPSTSEINWHPVFLVITDRLFLIFSQAPQTPKEWSLPTVSASLVVTRAVVGASTDARFKGDASFSHNRISQTEQFSECFVVRIGRRCGVETHTFAAPSGSELGSWVETITQSMEEALKATPKLTIACRWRGMDSLLMLHRFAGICLLRGDAASSATTTPRPPQFIWHFPFERVSSTADDGKSRLWITFDRSSVQEFDLPGGAKPVVFTLLNILSLKLMDCK